MRRRAVLDRVVVGLLGLFLLAAGLVLVAWELPSVNVLPRRLDAHVVLDLLDASWWPWAYAVVGVVLGLLGVVWLLVRVPRPTGTVIRVLGADDDGTTGIDLTSVATAGSEQFGRLAEVRHAKGSYRRVGETHVVEVSASVDPETRSDGVQDAARRVAEELGTAFDSAPAHLRVLLGGPPRLRR